MRKQRNTKQQAREAAARALAQTLAKTGYTALKKAGKPLSPFRSSDFLAKHSSRD